MEKKDFKTALDFLKTLEKRKFKQSVDLIINLKNLNLKQNEQQVDTFIQVPFSRGKKIKICCLCGPELAANAKENCDLVIITDDFVKYQSDKKLVKKLANEYDFFIAQANIMPEVAKTFGRVLGPKAKMPNPKAGAVVPPNANLKPIVEKFLKTIRLTAKTQMCIKTRVGKEEQKDEEVVDNAFAIFDQLRKILPQEMNNIKNVLLKLTMSRPVPVGVNPEELKKRWEEIDKHQEELAKKRLAEVREEQADKRKRSAALKKAAKEEPEEKSKSKKKKEEKSESKEEKSEEAAE